MSIAKKSLGGEVTLSNDMEKLREEYMQEESKKTDEQDFSERKQNYIL